MADDKKLNDLIRGELTALKLAPDSPPSSVEQWRDFLNRINALYYEYEEKHFLIYHALRISSAQLRSLNQKLEHAQRIALMGYWSYNKVSERITLSKELLHMLGFEHENCEPKVHELLKLVHDDDKASLVSSIREALDKNKEFDIEVRACNPDKRYHWYRCVAHPELDQSEAVMHLTCVVLDVTPRKLLEEERAYVQELADKNVRLEKEIMRVQEADRLKNEFLANMSHELRTPLNTVIGFTEIIYFDKVHPVSPQQKEFLYDVLKCAKHLLHLINDVLDLAKIETGRIEFEAKSIVLSDLINEACELLKNSIHEKNMQISVKIDKAVNHIVNDASKIQQILFNFLSNSLKFTANKGDIIITVAPYGPKHFILEVQDTGIGIQQNELKELFIPFKQLDAGLAKKYAGTGLGLAITRLIVEAQGGSVGVKSELGKGSAFYAILPRVLKIK